MIRSEIQTVSLLLIDGLNMRKWKGGERRRKFERHRR